MAKKDEEKIFALLCYLISIIGVVIVLLTKKERGKFSLYHAKQGLILFIAWIAMGIIATILGYIPFLGALIGAVLWILVFVLWIIGIINSLTDKQEPLPVIGKYAEKWDF
ncbi:DUF4870 domain-containing protein [Candidatus Woesearchaeota archaeon]|nr:DUF4870 domain-containing protein [Candidatus Woesearchaeota archaeon]